MSWTSCQYVSGFIIFKSFAILQACSSWQYARYGQWHNYAVFKKNFIGRRSDDHISRRVSLLPTVLPLVLLLPTFVSGFILNAVDRALRSLEPEEFLCLDSFDKIYIIMISQFYYTCLCSVPIYTTSSESLSLEKYWEDLEMWKSKSDST